MSISPKQSREPTHAKLTGQLKVIPDRLCDRRILEPFQKLGLVNIFGTGKIRKKFILCEILITSHKMLPAQTSKKRTPPQDPIAEPPQQPARAVRCRRKTMDPSEKQS